MKIQFFTAGVEIAHATWQAVPNFKTIVVLGDVRYLATDVEFHALANGANPYAKVTLIPEAQPNP